GPILGMTPAQALTAIQTMADQSQKWHDGTTSKNIRSSSSKDVLVALDLTSTRIIPTMRKLNKWKRSDIENLDEQRLLTSRTNEGNFCVGPPRYYTKTGNRPTYGERKQSL
ncbi:hypothetical protein Tco_1355564, partial [Tanacetum coccineum]